jgi:hypothetical protein
VRKRQRRLTGVSEIVLSRYAGGPATGEISAHFEQIYGRWVCPDRSVDGAQEQLTGGRLAVLEISQMAAHIEPDACGRAAVGRR